MKLKITLGGLILLFTISAFAQKAKFKSAVCSIQKAALPKNYVDPANMTYDIGTKGSYAYRVDKHSGKLYGWTLNEENPNNRAVVSIYGYRTGKAKKDSKKQEKKDKDGKVTSSWTEYSYSSTATGLATLYIYGEGEAYSSKKKKNSKKDDEKKAKQEAKEEARKKDLADNPFLSEDDVEEAEESDIGEDSGLENADLVLYKTINVNQEESVSTKYYKKSADAYKDYSKQAEAYAAFYENYPEKAYKSAISAYNTEFGYKPTKERFYIKKMKTDDHPEYKNWNDAVQATYTLFKTIKFNKSIEDKQSKFKPIVDYFSAQLESLSPKDRKLKKHRKAAFNNLLNLLTGLDQHDDVIMWCDKYLSDKKLDSIAKRAKQNSENIKSHLAFLKMNSRHIESDDEVDEKDIEESELAEEEVEDN